MMNTPRTLLPLLFLALATCKVDDDNSDDDPVIAAQIELCMEVCAKQLCHPAFDPDDNFEQECRSSCTEIVEVAQNDGCTEHYQALLECTNALPCDDYSSWWGKPASETCPAEAEAVELNCPNVKLDNGIVPP